MARMTDEVAGRKRPPIVLTIAGSDSGGGAGIQADLKTLTVLGVYGASVVTALTAQNTQGVQGVHVPPPEFLKLQLDSVLGDLKPRVAKTGMLPTIATIRATVAALKKHDVRTVVVDPVMVATSGDSLAGSDFDAWLYVLRSELIPLATVVTPNLDEAGLLVGRELKTEGDVREAAREITALGCRSVLVKGGHTLPGDANAVAEEVGNDDVASDIMFDGVEYHAFSKPRLRSAGAHGTGCTLAAAIAAEIAKGVRIPVAVANAKNFVFDAMRAGFDVGEGSCALNHMHCINPTERR